VKGKQGDEQEAVYHPGERPTLGLSLSALIRNLSNRQKPSLARSYIQLFGIFDKFRLWQVISYSYITLLTARAS
jgi:hypothetical protein